MNILQLIGWATRTMTVDGIRTAEAVRSAEWGEGNGLNEYQLQCLHVVSTFEL